MEGVLVIDKPSGPTSHDVVNAVRRATKIKRVGHTGTLDPMATGVMVVLLGRATRIGRFLDLEPKEYVAEALFGVTTDTQDVTGTIVRKTEQPVDIDDVKAAISSFTGEIQQVPPMVSAVKVGGTPLYKLARRGREVERTPRPVTIYEFELLQYSTAGGRLKARFRIVCSAGTYVRTLIHDLGERVGAGATLSELRRTLVGRFTLAGAVSIESIEKDAATVSRAIIRTDDALEQLPEAIVRDNAVSLVLNGGRVQEDMLDAYDDRGAAGGFARIKNRENALLAIGRIIRDDGVTIAPEVVFN